MKSCMNDGYFNSFKSLNLINVLFADHSGQAVKSEVKLIVLLHKQALRYWARYHEVLKNKYNLLTFENLIFLFFNIQD